MRGKAVFYPMGWDDNGLPTERRVQNYFGVRCDPSLPYDPAFAPPDKPGKQPIPVSRPNFIELCARLTAEDEKVFEDLWRYLGLSVDWSMTYATIDRRAQRVSQLSFLRLLRRGPRLPARGADAVGRRLPHGGRAGGARGSRAAGRLPPDPVRADGRDGGFVEIDTTRPELIPACVALVAHPDDERYKPLFGTEVVTPLFGVRVPVRPHALADPEKGTGVAMICTFGDVTDVDLVARARRCRSARSSSRTARFKPVTWGERGLGVDRSRRARSSTTISSPACRPSRRGRGSSSCCKRAGDLIGEPRPITHAVKFYEKGDRPLEIVTSRQWFIKTMDFREDAARARPRAAVASAVHAGAARELDQRPGRRLVRQPAAVLRRAVSASGTRCAATAPSTTTRGCCRPRIGCRSIRRPTCPTGYRADQRDQPGGFTGDPDIMDTWATSSLTPQIAGALGRGSGPVRARVPDGRASAGARHHPHVAVLDRAAVAPRVRHAAVEATPRFPAGCSIPTARRCRSRRATS